MNTKNIVLAMAASLLLIGCGGGGGTTPNNEEEATEITQTITIPTKIDMEMPKLLIMPNNTTQNKTARILHKEETNESSFAYEILKDEIAYAESLKTNLQADLILANEMMPMIEEYCQDIPINTTCIIEEDELTFTLEQELIDEINTISEEPLDASFIEEPLLVGRIEFTEYNNNPDYRYALTIDTTKMEQVLTNIIHLGIELSIQTIKWTKDENSIYSSYSYQDKHGEINFTLDYLKKVTGQKELQENFYIKDMDMDIESTFNLKLIDKATADKRYEIRSNSNNIMYIEGQRKQDQLTSFGEISNQGGFLNFTSILDDNIWKDKELFDADGNLIASTYCATLFSCDLNDETTWLSFEDENTELNTTSNLIQLNIAGGNLQEGAYLLFPPNTETANMSLDQLFNNSIGDISKFSDFTF